MIRTLLGVLLLILPPLCTGSEAGILRFVVYHPHLPPYIYNDSTDNAVVGIIPELLTPFFRQQNIRVEYLYDNRAGAEQRLYKGEVDAMMLSPDWAKQPDKLLFTDGVMPYRDYLFARTKQEVSTSAGQLQGKTICTREYYMYPILEPLFTEGVLLRLDSSSQEAQLRMVLNKRCDLVYMNDLIVYWLAEQKFERVQLYPTDLLMAQSQLHIAFNPRWREVLPKLNAYLMQQQQNGELHRIIQRYITPQG